MAKDRGLEPLADFIWDNRENSSADPVAEAESFIVKSEDKEKSVPLGVDALAGARDILAERFSDDADCRAELRDLMKAALCLGGMCICIGGLYWTLYAPYVALFQMLIYGGAVVVLFVSVIMFIRGTEDG